MTQIEHLLRETIGLDAASIGSSLIQRTVRLRMKTLGVRRYEDYKRLLESSRTEWTELVEAVVVTETWFFRGRESLAAFVRLVQEEWLPTHPSGPLHLLSIPCSSGEEPYSVVMALLDAGLPPDRFQIDAVDISARALARAQRGIFGKNSFRGTDLAFRKRYFQSTREGFILNLSIRRCVHFLQENLLAENFLAARGQYDFIFCRNLLIYFNRSTQRKALDRIDRLLAPAGTLFIGPAEQPLVLDHGFVSANIPMAFACRKTSQHALRARPHLRPPRVLPSPTPLPALPPTHSHQPQLPPNGDSEGPAPGSPPQVLHPDLEQARRLADAGQFQAAAALCEAHLRESRASACAYYLLGLVRDAAGDESAMDYYRKALYLEPNHYETLLQMALLAQKNGDPDRARTFRRRAERSKTKP